LEGWSATPNAAQVRERLPRSLREEMRGGRREAGLRHRQGPTDHLPENPDAVKDHVGHHVQVTGSMNSSGSLHVASVKMLPHPGRKRRRYERHALSCQASRTGLSSFTDSASGAGCGRHCENPQASPSAVLVGTVDVGDGHEHERDEEAQHKHLKQVNAEVGTRRNSRRR